MKKRNLIRFSVIGAAAAVLPLVGVGQAFGDYAPQSGDIVGVGGDTPQYALDFLVNGDTNGHLGFDASTGVNRVIPFDATADANGRQAYTQGSTEASPVRSIPPSCYEPGTTRSSDRRAARQLSTLWLRTPTPLRRSTMCPVPPLRVSPRNQGSRTFPEASTTSTSARTRSRSPWTRPRLTLLLGFRRLSSSISTTAPRRRGALPDYSGPAPLDSIIAEIPPSTSSVYSNFVAALTAADASFTMERLRPDRRAE